MRLRRRRRYANYSVLTSLGKTHRRGVSRPAVTTAVAVAVTWGTGSPAPVRVLVRVRTADVYDDNNSESFFFFLFVHLLFAFISNFTIYPSAFVITRCPTHPPSSVYYILNVLSIKFYWILYYIV